MIGYFDCFSGASGDMILGALADVGLDVNQLRAELNKLALPGEWDIEAEPVHRGAVGATLMRVTTLGAPPLRHLPDILAIIRSSGISATAKQRSSEVFERLAVAEAQVHGVPLEHVHFHEVGAVDSIIDIVGAVVGLELLGIDELYASALPLGGGSTRSEHGTIPLPAPATLALLAQAGAPTRHWGDGIELVTPTGAAILTTLATFQQPALTLKRVGCGAGGRDLAWPNILRLWLGERPAEMDASHVQIETNIDDMNPEFFGHVMERLFASGALDVFTTPIYMKKNRLGTILSVIAPAHREKVLADVILRETTTFGVRVRPIARHEAERRIVGVTTPFGEVAVKIKLLQGEALAAAPEYEDCRRIASEQGVPITTVYKAAEQAGINLLATMRAD